MKEFLGAVLYALSATAIVAAILIWLHLWWVTRHKGDTQPTTELSPVDDYTLGLMPVAFAGALVGQLVSTSQWRWDELIFITVLAALAVRCAAYVAENRGFRPSGWLAVATAVLVSGGMALAG